MGPASTDAVNRSVNASYGEVTGITQTVRNYASTLGIAVLGTVLASRFSDHLTRSLGALGVPSGVAKSIAKGSTEAGGAKQANSVPAAVRGHIERAVAHDFAVATQAVLYGMAIALAACFLVAQRHPGGRQESEAVSEP